jgi:hypothetical protein
MKKVEEIQNEAVRRLIFSPHKFTLQDVDDLGFFSLARITNSSGLLWDTTQRSVYSQRIVHSYIFS